MLNSPNKMIMVIGFLGGNVDRYVPLVYVILLQRVQTGVTYMNSSVWESTSM